MKLHKALTDGSAEKTESKGEVVSTFRDTHTHTHTHIHTHSQMTVTIESVEIYLESEGADVTPGHPVLTLTITAALQLFEWTGNVSLVLLM